MYKCSVLADSVNPMGIRLTTLEITYPRIVHAEFMTHRVFSRNAASNRAIPLRKTISMVESNPFIPLSWPREQKGMVGGEELDLEKSKEAEKIWLDARNDMVHYADLLLYLGVHKSIPNRLLEPFQWITVIVSSTEWANFFSLRIADDAEQHIRKIAAMMWNAIDQSTPIELQYSQWHLPYIADIDRQEILPLAVQPPTASQGAERIYADILLAKVSAARTARVSYLNHGGGRNLTEDIFMCDNKLITPGHWSPLEHPCQAMNDRTWRGNIRGFRQLRKYYPRENRHIYNGLAEVREIGNAESRV